MTCLTGIVILYPYLDYQPHLAPGDHGRDLYTYKVVYDGGIPYRDFSSQHGPLMPYYYSLFYRLFDVSISSTLLGYNLCILLAGLLVYLVCAIYLDPLISFAAALWYWVFRGSEFFYTYNHIGGVVMMLATVYFFIRYVKDSNIKFIYSGSVSVAFLLLIRPTIGLSTLTAYFLFLIIRNATRENNGQKSSVLPHYLLAFCVAISSLSVYWLLTNDAPRHGGESGMDFWQHFNPGKIPGALTALYQVVKIYFFANALSALFSVVLSLAATVTLFRLTDLSSDRECKKQLLTIFGFLSTLIIFNLGELLVTGIWFYALWNLTLIAIMIFYIFNIGYSRQNRFIKIIVIAGLLLPAFNILRVNKFLATVKQPYNELWIGKNRVYLLPTERRLIHTLTQATLFIINHTAENEKFLAIPYDPIYYYLSNRGSPTTQLFILKMSKPREKRLLEEIENNKINYILLSNRAYRDFDKRFGVLGRDYGTDLQKYMDDFFEEVATYGPWEAHSGWTANHAVKILKRK